MMSYSGGDIIERYCSKLGENVVLQKISDTQSKDCYKCLSSHLCKNCDDCIRTTKDRTKTNTQKNAN